MLLPGTDLPVQVPVTRPIKAQFQWMGLSWCWSYRCLLCAAEEQQCTLRCDTLDVVVLLDVSSVYLGVTQHMLHVLGLGCAERGWGRAPYPTLP